MINDLNENDILELNQLLIKNRLSVINYSEVLTNPFIRTKIYRLDKKIVGYLNYSIMYENAELNQVLVDSLYRNKGIGSLLLEHFLSDCKNCDNISLEVREDNLTAIKLYEKFGFAKVAIRKNYYGDIDGILMVYNKRGE